MWSFNVNLKTNSIQLNEEKLKKIEKKLKKNWKMKFFLLIEKLIEKIEKNWYFFEKLKKNWKKLKKMKKIEKIEFF